MAQILAFGSALCLVAGSLIGLLVITAAVVPQYPTFVSSTYPLGRLDCDYLEELWTWRRLAFPFLVAGEVAFASVCLLTRSHSSLMFGLQGVLLLVHPLSQIVKILTRQGVQNLRYAMFHAFQVGTVLNFVEVLQILGTELTGKQISGIPLTCSERQVLEIAYNLGEARSVLLFSLSYLLFGIGFILAGVLAFSTKVFSRWHAVLGFVCAALCVAAFVLEVLQVLGSNLSIAFGIVNFLWGGIGFPIWAVWLGVVLGGEWKIERVVRNM